MAAARGEIVPAVAVPNNNGPKPPGNNGPKVNQALLNQLAAEINGKKRPYRRTGAFLRGAGAVGAGLVNITGRGLSATGAALKRLTRTNAALLAKLQTELKNLESKETPTNENRRAIVNKTARIAQILGTKNPARRANITAVAGYATGKNNLPNVPTNTNFNFSGNPYAEISRARQVYNKSNRSTKDQIIGKILKGMTNIWKNRTSDTVAKATLKHIVNRGPKHPNISKMYQNLAGRPGASSSSSSNIAKLFGLRPSSSSLLGMAPSLLKSLGGSSNVERLLRSRGSVPPPSYPMAVPAPSYPMAVPAPSYPAAMPMPPPSYPALPPMPPRIRNAVNNAGGINRANTMVRNIGGPEMVRETSRALVKAHGNINVAARQTGLPPKVFQNVKNLGGPTIAPKVARLVVRVPVPVRVTRRRRVTVPVPVVRRRRPVGITKRRRSVKKTRRVLARKGPTIKDIKKLVHKLRKSELETRVVQCLMR